MEYVDIHFSYLLTISVHARFFIYDFDIRLIYSQMMDSEKVYP